MTELGASASFAWSLHWCA